MQPAQRAQARRALGRQHIGRPIADLVALVGGHLGQQPVQRGVPVGALDVAAVVVKRSFVRRAAEGVPTVALAGRGVAVGVRKRQRVPDRRFDRVLQVLVGRVTALVARGELQLGEEIATEGAPAQVADVALLGVELGLFLDGRRRTRAGELRAVMEHVRQRPTAPEHAERHHDQQDQKREDQEREPRRRRIVTAAAMAIAAVVAATPGFLGFDRNQ